MKLLNFYIGEYRVLRDVDIVFDAAETAAPYSLNFLVGVNGTGKSTVLRALVDVLLQLDADRQVSFPFALEYTMKLGGVPARISWSNLPDPDAGGQVGQTQPLRILVDGHEDTPRAELLPPRVIVFTTGSEVEWQSLTDREASQFGSRSTLPEGMTPEEQMFREIPGASPSRSSSEGNPRERSRFQLIRTKRLPLVSLCGMLADLADGGPVKRRRLQGVLDAMRLDNLQGFSLRFRLLTGLTREEDMELVRTLARRSTRAVRQGSERLLIFDLGADPQTTARELLDLPGQPPGALELFRNLNRLMDPVEGEDAVLTEVNLFLTRQPSSEDDGGAQPPLLLFDELSDGERSFLGRMALFPLLGHIEGLILLDEPEVHFNDSWKRRIGSLLDAVLAEQDSHVLMATHSSITLTDVPREDVVVFERKGRYTRFAHSPSFKTLASDPSDVLVHVFEAPYASGERGIQRVDEAIRRYLESPTEENTKQLRVLQSQVGPGYWSYRLRSVLPRES
jgi:ABC-type transport system involved in cytochrome c biogenesis ATPase subunit